MIRMTVNNALGETKDYKVAFDTKRCIMYNTGNMIHNLVKEKQVVINNIDNIR